MDKVIEAVKEKKTLRGTGDNWDMMIRAHHMRSTAQNQDLHLFASNLYVNRKETRYKFLERISRFWLGEYALNFAKKFKFLEKVIPEHIEHRFTSEMSAPSTIIPLPIINADEKKYDDCVVILRSYEKWINEIYEKAVKVLQNKGVTVSFGGDQLTRVRFDGATSLLAGAHKPADRFEHCSPYKHAMWHTKASLLQYGYHLLHKAQSSSEKGTLKYFRERYNRKNATPAKVLDSYE
ncbi:Hypothetical predicted protein, partial [Paramuricea clavata]